VEKAQTWTARGLFQRHAANGREILRQGGACTIDCGPYDMGRDWAPATDATPVARCYHEAGMMTDLHGKTSRTQHYSDAAGISVALMFEDRQPTLAIQSSSRGCASMPNISLSSLCRSLMLSLPMFLSPLLTPPPPGL